jgi:hypothetical protein
MSPALKLRVFGFLGVLGSLSYFFSCYVFVRMNLIDKAVAHGLAALLALGSGVFLIWGSRRRRS